MVAKTRSLFARPFLLIAVLGLVVLSLTAAVAVEKLGGTSRPGAHSFTAVADMECAECHPDVAAELEANPHVTEALSDCRFCHTPSADGHCAGTARCSDCHSMQAGEVVADAHAGMSVQLGEDPTMMSLTCIACHTDVEVKIKTKTEHPLEFTIGADA